LAPINYRFPDRAEQIVGRQLPQQREAFISLAQLVQRDSKERANEPATGCQRQGFPVRHFGLREPPGAGLRPAFLGEGARVQRVPGLRFSGQTDRLLLPVESRYEVSVSQEVVDVAASKRVSALEFGHGGADIQLPKRSSRQGQMG